MRVSQKTEYALRAMLELARQSGQPHPVRSADIAKEQKIPEKFLEMILVELRHAGLIGSTRGPIGGHRLAREPERITVGEIWRAIEGDSLRAKEASKHDPFAHIWIQVDEAVAEVVDNVSLSEIRARADARQGVPDFSI